MLLVKVGFVFVGIVEKREAEAEVLSAELGRKRRKGIGGSDSSVGGAVERHISGTVDVSQAGNLAILGNCKFDRNFALLEQWRHGRLRNDVVPVLLHVVQHTLQVGAKIHPLSVRGYFHRAHAGGRLPLVESEIAVLAGVRASVRGGSTSGLLDRLA